jgi:UDP-N-acetyl-D-glucosamine dehydrogenase
MRKYEPIEMMSEALTPERLRRADAVLIVTDHAAIDWAMVGREAKLVIDTRNAMTRVAEVCARVVKA